MELAGGPGKLDDARKRSLARCGRQAAPGCPLPLAATLTSFQAAVLRQQQLILEGQRRLQEAQALPGGTSGDGPEHHFHRRVGGSRRPAPSLKGNAALKSPTSADAPERPVLDVRTSRAVTVCGVPNGGYARARSLVCSHSPCSGCISRPAGPSPHSRPQDRHVAKSLTSVSGPRKLVARTSTR
jgi:hypothetical protein